MRRQRSIGNRLQRAKSTAVKLEIVAEWISDKQDEVQAIKDKIEYAWQHHDEIAMREALDSLLDIKLKSLPAINNIAKQMQQF